MYRSSGPPLRTATADLSAPCRNHTGGEPCLSFPAKPALPRALPLFCPPRHPPCFARSLAEHPAQADWGISFLEIVRTGTFTIDGRAPNWPEGGAAALWCARVAPSLPTADLGPGQPFLTLEFWMPDSSYVTYMRGKGYPASYGQVKLLQPTEGMWRGSGGGPRLSPAAAVSSNKLPAPHTRPTIACPLLP